MAHPIGGRQRWALEFLARDEGGNGGGNAWHPACGALWTTPAKTAAIFEALLAHGLTEAFTVACGPFKGERAHRLNAAGRKAHGLGPDPVETIAPGRIERNAPERGRRTAAIGEVEVAHHATDAKLLSVSWSVFGTRHEADVSPSHDERILTLEGRIRRRLPGSAQMRAVSTRTKGIAPMWDEVETAAIAILEARRQAARTMADPLRRALQGLLDNRPGAAQAARDLLTSIEG